MLQDTKYEEILKDFDRVELSDIAYTIGVCTDDDQLDEMPLSKIRREIKKYIFGKPEKWLFDLPLYDLTILSELLAKKYAFIPTHIQLPIIDYIAVYDYITEDEDDEGSEISFLNSDIRQLIAPHVDGIIAKKKELREDQLEKALNGIANITGVIDENLAIEILHNEMPKVWEGFTSQAIDDFLSHSMLKRQLAFYDENGQPMFLSRLVGNEAWMPNLRYDLDQYVPSDVDEIMGHGTLPFMIPTRRCEKDLCEFLRQKKFAADEINFMLTNLYATMQTCGLKISQVISDELIAWGINDRELEKAINILSDFSNQMPKYHLRGNCPVELMAKFRQQQQPVVPTMASSRFAEDMPPFLSMSPHVFGKIGRDDRCPCGSGKKYKDCCGKSN